MLWTLLFLGLSQPFSGIHSSLLYSLISFHLNKPYLYLLQLAEFSIWKHLFCNFSRPLFLNYFCLLVYIKGPLMQRWQCPIHKGTRKNFWSIMNVYNFENELFIIVVSQHLPYFWSDKGFKATPLGTRLCHLCIECHLNIAYNPFKHIFVQKRNKWEKCWS